MKEGTSFDDVLNLYVFDRELRLLMLDAIERIEVSLRTQMAYHLSHNHKSSHPHLKPGIFYDRYKYNLGLESLEREVAKINEEFIRHLKAKYEESLPPIWAVVELMTMGQLSKWFSNIKDRHDRQSISKVYGLDQRVMTSFFQYLSLVRNHSAHHSRLWNRDFTKKMILPKRGADELIESLFCLPEKDRRLRKLYNAFSMTIYLMNIVAPNNHWKSRLRDLIETHRIDPGKMGFPDNWEERPLWC